MVKKDPHFKDHLGNLLWSRKGVEYKHWGNDKEILNNDFSKWWDKKKHLFENLSVRKIDMDKFQLPNREDEIMYYSNTINLNIPLNQPISKTLKEVQKIVENDKNRKMNDL